MTEAPVPAPRALPYDRIGGRAPIRRIVDRFYDLMEQEPRFAKLRAIHAPDLAPMRVSLADFLVAWTGGPRDWFETRPGACMMSMHAGLAGLDGETAAQWALAMKQAIEETLPADPDLAGELVSAIARMCKAMAVRAADRREAAALS